MRAIRKKIENFKKINVIVVLIAMAISVSACAGEVKGSEEHQSVARTEESVSTGGVFSLEAVPSYRNEPYVVMNNNVPYFDSSELQATSFEEYTPLDELGRCGVAEANIGIDLMPTEERTSISSVKPTGWHSIQYEEVEGTHLYNRCHLLGFQLTGENANEQNLITGTRAMNVDGMLPFENMIADYVKETDNHVYLRVTPIYQGDELLARGVLMEAQSVEDDGEGILFNVFCYNAQPGITIDYATGASAVGDDSIAVIADVESTQDETNQDEIIREGVYVLNLNTKKIHMDTCRSVEDMNEANKGYTNERVEDMLALGYERCKICEPK